MLRTALSAQPRLALRRALAGLAACLLLFGGGFVAHAAETVEIAADAAPDEVVRQTSAAILEIIEVHQDSFSDAPGPYFEAVDSQMARFVDYGAIARAVMARYWANASAEQRERFVVSFRRGLVRTYARALLEFEQERIEVLPMKPEHLREDRALVRMNIVGGNSRVYPLQYSMGRGDDGSWRVRNVIVDGVNLGLTYRNQFASAMQTGDARGDLDAVIDGWSIGGL